VKFGLSCVSRHLPDGSHEPRLIRVTTASSGCNGFPIAVGLGFLLSPTGLLLSTTRSFACSSRSGVPGPERVFERADGCLVPQRSGQFGERRSHSIPARRCPNTRLGTATSANWNVTSLAWRATLAPILTSFSRSVVSDQRRMLCGEASRRLAVLPGPSADARRR
jgi:hypothetical protein